MERETRFELATICLEGRDSTVELLPQSINFQKNNMEPTVGLEPNDLFLTKEVLYLLSYVGL